MLVRTATCILACGLAESVDALDQWLHHSVHLLQESSMWTTSSPECMLWA